MNERSLACFLEVYRTGNMRLAAQKLYVTPQSVSQTVLGLEEEMGEKLFLRDKRRLVPTRAAVELKRHAEKILGEYRAIRQKRSAGSERASVKIYCTFGVVEFLGPAFVRDLERARPDILPYLVELPDKQALDLLRRGEPALAILSDPSERKFFTARYLFTSPYSYVVPKDHPLAKAGEISALDMDGVPLVVKGDEFQLYTNQMSRYSKADLAPKIVLETTSYYLSMEMAAAGLALAFVPTYLARAHTYEGAVIVNARADPEKNFYLVRSNGMEMDEAAQALEAFLTGWVKERCAELGLSGKGEER